MKKLTIFIALVSLGAFPIINCGGGGGGTNTGDQGYQQVTDQNITLKWKVSGANLDLKVSAPTTGWVAVGFPPDHNALMELGTNLIVGYVKNGAVSIEDDYVNIPHFHQSDVALGGVDNVTNKTGTQSGGSTEIGFTIPLNSGDAYDVPLATGVTTTVLLAHALDGTTDFVTHHAVRTSVQITLQ
ncbi:MAG: DOMON domain-containing protein [Proteobacteria bacterium]|nr:DOMON domain-containing protein [Pseudomonadota bacterium]